MDLWALPWYHADLSGPAAGTAILKGDEWHHARHVMRLRPGDPVILFDGLGACHIARLADSDRAVGYFTLESDAIDQFSRPRPYRVFLGIAPTKQADRTEFALEKMTELGVDGIWLLQCEHSERVNVRPERLMRILIGAAKQSRKPWLPSLHGPVSPAEALAAVRHLAPGIACLAAHIDPEARPLAHTEVRSQDVFVLVGPEGGFSAAEVEQFRQSDVILVSLGPYRLRVETAAVAAVAGIHLLNEYKLPG